MRHHNYYKCSLVDGILLGTQCSASLCRDEWKTRWRQLRFLLVVNLYIQRHLDLLYGVGHSYSSKEIAQNCY